MATRSVRATPFAELLVLLAAALFAGGIGAGTRLFLDGLDLSATTASLTVSPYVWIALGLALIGAALLPIGFAQLLA